MDRNKLKDSFAWALIYGGSSLTLSVLAAAAVAAGIFDRGQSLRLLSQAKHASGFGHYQKIAWETYKKTGDISKALDVFFD